MIEVFRTNVNTPRDAARVLNKIHSAFPGYMANFDLDDCDHILRINSRETILCAQTIIGLLNDFGFRADILPDEVAEPLELH